MYQFSRSLYREMAHDVVPGRGEDITETRQRFLRACERSMERLALDRHYFAKPVRIPNVSVGVSSASGSSGSSGSSGG